MVNVIEDMSRDEATTYFIGNPGSGIAKDFPKGQRDYDGVSLFFTKNFSDKWLAQVSYTLSYLRGNIAGLYRSETGASSTRTRTPTSTFYNVANFQTAIAVDQTYTFSDVKPIKGGTVDDLKNLKDVYDEDVLKNPNFGNPVLYQLPRQFRFGARFNF
jgi:hypothetical protein